MKTLIQQTKTFKLLALVLSLSLLGACSSSPSAAQPSERQAKAMAMWQERCKTAGEKIYKTVENVEGVYLMKLRPVDANYGDQFKMDDPYGHDLDGAAYLRSFIQGHYSANHIGTPIAGSSSQPKGYPYVEAIGPEDGQRYHYTGRMKVTGRMDATAPNVQIDIKRDPNFDLNIYRFVLERVPASEKPPRYGVTYDDISTHEEREYWIAGSSLKVFDLQTNEVIAERIGYMVDRAQGNTAGGRSPWLFAMDNACPSFFKNPNHLPGPAFSASSYQAAKFVEQVLKPAHKSN